VRINVHRAEAHFSTDSFFCRSDVNFTASSIGSRFFWDFGVKNADDDTSNEKSPSFTFPKVGQYVITHVAIDGHCTDTVKQTIKILKKAGKGFAIPDTAICFGQKINIGEGDTSGGFTYSWTPATYLNNPFIGNPVSTPLEDITYVVTKSYDACVSVDTVQIHVIHPVADFTYAHEQNCDENKVQFSNTSEEADTYAWFIKDSLVSTQPSPRFTFRSGTNVNGYLIATNKGKCPVRKDFELNFPSLADMGIFIPNVLTPNSDGANDCFKVVGFTNSPVTCDPAELHIYNRWGEQVYSNPKICWDGTDERNGNKLKEGVYYYVLTFSGKTYKGTVTLLR
jgi:gliding motility-associated-like protein